MAIKTACPNQDTEHQPIWLFLKATNLYNFEFVAIKSACGVVVH